jgi:hypothetical protein
VANVLSNVEMINGVTTANVIANLHSLLATINASNRTRIPKIAVAATKFVVLVNHVSTESVNKTKIFLPAKNTSFAIKAIHFVATIEATSTQTRVNAIAVNAETTATTMKWASMATAKVELVAAAM